MNRNIYPIIVLGIALGAFFASCKPTVINKKNPNASASISNAGQCMSAADTAAAASSAIGTLTAPQLALADMDVDGKKVSVKSQYTSKKTPASVINIDYALLGNSDYSATFVLWKACTLDGKTCSNNGQFKKTYHFNISNIADLPTGLLNVSVKLCVDDKRFLVASDRKKAVNACSSASPCYCGKETKIKYANNVSSTNADPKFASAVANLDAAQAQLLTLAQSYIDQAQSYANSCKVADKNSIPMQYANNIAAMSSAELAGLVESYAGYLKATVDAQKQGGSLNLADASCSVGGGGMSSTGYSMGTGFSMGSGLAMGTSTTTYPSNTGTTILTPNNGNPTDTNVIVTNVSPSSTSTNSSGSPVMFGIGITTMVVGVAMLINYGVKLVSSSQKYGSGKNESLVDQISNRIFGKATHPQTPPPSPLSPASVPPEIAAELAREGGSLVQTPVLQNYDELHRNLTNYTERFFEDFQQVNDILKFSEGSLEEGRTKIFSTDLQSKAFELFYQHNAILLEIQDRMNAREPFDDLIAKLRKNTSDIASLLEHDIYPKLTNLTPSDPKSAVLRSMTENLSVIDRNIGSMKQISDGLKPSEVVVNIDESHVTSPLPTEHAVPSAANERPIAGAPEPVAGKAKTSMIPEIGAVKGLMVGGVIAAIGALATYGGTGLAAGSCGNFQATMRDMETKLYNQYIQVKIAILQLQAAQTAASK